MLTREQIDEFFNKYEAFFSALDMDKTAELYADTLLRQGLKVLLPKVRPSL